MSCFGPYFVITHHPYFQKKIWTRNAADISTMSTLGKSQGEMGLHLIVFKSRIMVTLVNCS